MAERWHHREPDTKTVKTWYFMGSFSDMPEWMFAIDLHPDRLGWVYSCHKEDHASFEDIIIAKSFTEFLEQSPSALQTNTRYLVRRCRDSIHRTRHRPFTRNRMHSKMSGWHIPATVFRHPANPPASEVDELDIGTRLQSV
jgi:hypothetical protein